MCHTYAFKTFEKILYADTSIKLKGKSVSNFRVAGHSIYCHESFKIPFYFHLKDYQRYARPDLIHEPLRPDKDLGIYFDITEHPKNKSIIDVVIRLERQSSKHISDFFIRRMIKRGKNTTMRHMPPNTFKVYNRIIFEKIQNEFFNVNDNVLFLLDWKYISLDFLNEVGNQKISRDIRKQLFYELSIKSEYINKEIINQFVIPFYFPKDYGDVGEEVSLGDLNEEIKKSKIKIFKANFNKMQEIYLNDKN